VDVENIMHTIKGTPSKPGGWIHDMISPEAARTSIDEHVRSNSKIYNCTDYRISEQQSQKINTHYDEP
jgi:hypothetical protein